MLYFESIISVMVTVFGLGFALSAYVQAAKVIKNKSAKDVSLFYFSLATVNFLFWLIYGIIKKDVPISLTNAVALIGGLVTVAAILKFKNAS
jgi:MtN3 and saliva related transmembrane protein